MTNTEKDIVLLLNGYKVFIMDGDEKKEKKTLAEIKKLLHKLKDDSWWRGWDAGISNDPPNENSWEFCNP